MSRWLFGSHTNAQLAAAAIAGTHATVVSVWADEIDILEPYVTDDVQRVFKGFGGYESDDAEDESDDVGETTTI
jgi:hypothetical protein